jgi:hypothetical protein
VVFSAMSQSSYGRVGRIGVSAYRKGSDVTLDLDLGSIGIRQARSSIRRLALTPIRRYADCERRRSPVNSQVLDHRQASHRQFGAAEPEFCLWWKLQGDGFRAVVEEVPEAPSIARADISRKDIHFQMFRAGKFFDDSIEQSLIRKDGQIADLSVNIGDTLTVWEADEWR